MEDKQKKEKENIKATLQEKNKDNKDTILECNTILTAAQIKTAAEEGGRKKERTS